MAKIVEVFEAQKCQVPTDKKGQLKLQVVIEWPITAGLKGAKEYKKSLKWAKHLNNYHPNI